MPSAGPSIPPHLTSASISKPPDSEHRKQTGTAATGSLGSYVRRCHNHSFHLTAQQQSAPPARDATTGGADHKLYTQQNPDTAGYFHLFPNTSRPSPPGQRWHTGTARPTLCAPAGTSLLHPNFLHHLFPTGGTCKSFYLHPFCPSTITDPHFSSCSWRGPTGSSQVKPAEAHSERSSSSQHGPYGAAPKLRHHSATLYPSRYSQFIKYLKNVAPRTKRKLTDY